MPLTTEQARQIDWQALLERIISLYAPLSAIRQTFSSQDDPAEQATTRALDDVLLTIAAIEATLAKAQEAPTDATTP